MPSFCFKCSLTGLINCDRSTFVRHGSYYRSSDKKTLLRYRCKICRSTFSRAHLSPFHRQKKRQHNFFIAKSLSSTNSQRRLAKILGINRKTVVRAYRLMADIAEAEAHERNSRLPRAKVIEFDDLETFEHTKCKPLSVTVAVESGTRRILGIEVSRMPASGLLAKKSRAKYGARADERSFARRRLFSKIQDLVDPFGEIKSDANPHYSGVVKEFFPHAVHKRYMGKRGSLGGQGELKKVKFDPLFSLNHTCAKMRADINRLIRKTWCTTKSPGELYRHLMLFADYHNKNLPPSVSTG